MRLNRIEKPILLGAVGDLERYQAMPEPEFRPTDQRMLNLREAIWAARRGIVRCQPAEWLQMSLEDNAVRQAVSRAYKRLQVLGLVKRVAAAWSDTYCTHLRPTPDGIRLAEQLTNTANPATTTLKG